jgi:hypothetical protein
MLFVHKVNEEARQRKAFLCAAFLSFAQLSFPLRSFPFLCAAPKPYAAARKQVALRGPTRWAGRWHRFMRMHQMHQMDDITHACRRPPSPPLTPPLGRKLRGLAQDAGGVQRDRGAAGRARRGGACRGVRGGDVYGRGAAPAPCLQAGARRAAQAGMWMALSLFFAAFSSRMRTPTPIFSYAVLAELGVAAGAG